MAKKGLSKLVTAKYNYDGKNVSYTNPKVQEKMAEYSAEIEVSEPNNLYLDNEIAETDGGTFASGTLTLTTGDLSNDTSLQFFNTTQKDIQVGDKTVTEVTYDDAISPQELGIGIIELHQVNHIEFYRAIWFDRVKFNIVSDSATTKGETVDWQTQEISGTILRSEMADEDNVHPWKHTADCQTEADALSYLMFKGGKVETSSEEGN